MHTIFGTWRLEFGASAVEVVLRHAMRSTSLLILYLTIGLCGCTGGPHPPVLQEQKTPDRLEYADFVRQYVDIDEPLVALSRVDVIDGTGTSILTGQTILIENGFIKTIAPSQSFNIPPEARVLELEGHTVIPGIVGTHNHLHMPRVPFMGLAASRLYLGSGVTTIQTTGSASPAREKSLADSIHSGLLPGPDIFHTGPYFNGAGGSPAMITPRDSAHIDEVIKYWTGEGVRWFKVYRHIRPDHLQDVIRIAHAYGARVTGHLCSVTYAEAARMGIDAIEHGFIHSYDHSQDKQDGVCSGSTGFRDSLSIDSTEVDSILQVLIENGVGLSSTPSIFEAQIPGRAIADERTLDVMAPWLVDAYHERQRRMRGAGDSWHFKEAWFRKSMDYNLRFFRKGGLLTVGPDPGLHNMPGYGDQRNFVLLREAGFTTEEAVQVMTSNGARLLERSDIGTVEPGKRADLVVLRGDLSAAPESIQHVVLVFKEGYGFDPEKLIADVMGKTGDR